MRFSTARSALVALLSCLGLTPESSGQITTVITHGFTAGSKGVWVQGMADAIVARAGEGSVFRYDEASGNWTYVSTPNSDGTLNVIVLIFNWTPESASVNNGPNWNYVQAAADALYTALRAPHYIGASGPPGTDLVTNRIVHFIGHSRGACLNSEAAQRLALANVPVDQISTLDPHPVNGTLDAPFNYNWGDPVPQKWQNVTWMDDMWRADGGGFNALDFDGIPLTNSFNTQLSEAALNCCGYSLSHSDVHLWYHGTIDTSPSPCDGEQCINATMRQTWWPEGYTNRGYYYSVIGGGSAERAAQSPGLVPPATPLIYGGDFANASYAGWSYHGGSVNGQIVLESGKDYLKLGHNLGISATHNRFFLPNNAAAIQLGYRILTAAIGESLNVRLIDFAGNMFALGSIDLGTSGDWITDFSLPIGGNVPRGVSYRLQVAIQSGAAPNSIVGIDNVEITTATPVPGDVTGDGCVNVDDLLAVINSWGACPSPPPPPPANCPADIAPPQGDGLVNVDDLLAVINAWAPCP